MAATSLLLQIIRDFEDPKEVNAQLEKMCVLAAFLLVHVPMNYSLHHVLRFLRNVLYT